MPQSGPARSCADEAIFVWGYPNLRERIAAVQPHDLCSIPGPHDTADWPTVTGTDTPRGQ
jgi:hypothetical protein